jgi:quercetin dioxygenase-like cupin family protein
MTKPAIPTLQSDTPEARVTHWYFPRGSATGHHRHEFDYVVVPLTDGVLTAVTASGRIENQLAAGKSYFRKAGVEHDIVNEAETDFAFVEVEIKR